MPRTYKREQQTAGVLLTENTVNVLTASVTGQNDRVAKLKNLKLAFRVRGSGDTSDGECAGYVGLYRVHKDVTPSSDIVDFDDRRLLRPVPFFGGFNDYVGEYFYPALDIHEDGQLYIVTMVTSFNAGPSPGETFQLDYLFRYARHDVTY